MASCNKIYKKETFENCNLEKLFENNKKITFIACTFINCFHSAGTGINHDIELRFSTNCKFIGEWEHILCNKITYSKCKFDEFTYSNIDKEKHVSEDLTLFDCTFNSIDCEGIIFIKPFIQIVDENKLKHIDNIKLTRCEFKDDFILNATDRNDERKLHEIKLDSIDLSHSIFYKKFKMQNCIVNNAAKFYNTSFKDLADFYKTKFNKVDFERTNFEKISVFSEVEFNKNIDFKYTKFIGKSIFRDTVIKEKLNLRNTIFDDDANFLDITSKTREKDNNEFIGETKIIKVANRETARVIKNFFDKSGNIIEANKFYALEMKEREKELSGNLLLIIDWFIFMLHRVVSNYSQDWFLALMWICLLSVFYTLNFYGIPIMEISIKSMFFLFLITYLMKKFEVLNKYYIIPITMMSITALISYYFSYSYFDSLSQVWNTSIYDKSFFNEMVKNINPFSNLNFENMTFGLFTYKIALSYLIYQFIISVRQNTRRK